MDVQKAVRDLPSGLATTTRREAFLVLRTVIRQAVAWDILQRDPTAGVKAPKVPQQEMRAWSIEEVTRFFSTARGYRHFALYALALATGMRMGEILALRWEDVNTEESTVMVKRSLAWLHGEPYFHEPKTAGSIRRIPVGADILATIKAHRKEQLEERLAAGPHWEDNGLVFGRVIGAPVLPSVVRRRMQLIAKAAGVPSIRFHDLPHTHSTLLLQAGVPVKVVAERLGHTNVATTLRVYAHVLPNMQEAAVKALEGMF